jgi:Fe-Mn family superoxide dismutase
MDKHVSRRDFMKTAAQAGAALTLASAPGMLFAETKTPAAKPSSPGKTVSMVKLPYAENALEPFISSRTVNLHYNKHHQGYLTMISGWLDSHPDFQNQTLEELILKYKNGVRFEEAIFQYSILLYNHNWYWQSLKPKAGGIPKGKVEKMIVASHGSYDAFKKSILDESMKLGIGWVWIVQDGEKINAYRSEYLDTPLLKGYRPLLAIDVWEHAYYLDYQNERQKYVEAIVNNLLNWDFAEQNIVQKTK